MQKAVSDHMRKIGQSGGRKSRRTLTPEQARDMVRVREAQRAYRTYYARCFWSSPEDLKITLELVPWVAQQLRNHGDMELWRLAAKLC